MVQSTIPLQKSNQDPSGADKRFGFGKNWKRFLTLLSQERIERARDSLTEMLEEESLEQKSFIDIGCGSGLFSLVARQLGAKVHSFDYDNNSVDCAKQLRQKFFENDPNWKIEQGSVLNKTYLESLGQFDVVYSWGVLHHTGDMWSALGNVVQNVKPGGKLFISIYNDQGALSSVWTRIKRTYCSSSFGAALVLIVFMPIFIVARFLMDLLKFKNPFATYRLHREERGMSLFVDWIDWLGGYPFEVAKPEELFDFYRQNGFTLTKLKTRGGRSGVNELVFVRT